MNDKTATNRAKAKSAAETPVHTIREGAVVTMIWRRQSPSGFSYLDFSLTREYRSLSSGSTGSSRNFFTCNQQELIKVIQQATEWIAKNEKQHEPAA